MLIAILVISLPLSWLGVRMERARRQREAVEVIERLGGSVTYAPTELSVPKWILELLGDDFFRDVVHILGRGNFGDDETAY